MPPGEVVPTGQIGLLCDVIALIHQRKSEASCSWRQVRCRERAGPVQADLGFKRTWKGQTVLQVHPRSAAARAREASKHADQIPDLNEHLLIPSPSSRSSAVEYLSSFWIAPTAVSRYRPPVLIRRQCWLRTALKLHYLGILESSTSIPIQGTDGDWTHLIQHLLRFPHTVSCAVVLLMFVVSVITRYFLRL